MHISFLGLGNMGLPMARNLLGLGHTVTVYNRTPGRAKILVARGAVEAGTIAEAVKRADIAITMLADDTVVNAVTLGPDGLLQHLPKSGIHLCMSTIGIQTSAALATAHARAGQGYVAAPVFGRASAAATRHLWIVAGGPEPQVNRCLSIFTALGRGHSRVGSKAALAHAIKLGGQRITAAMEQAVAEILPFATQVGMAPADYLRLLNTTILRFHMVDSYGEAPLRPSLDPEDRALDLAANDMLFPAAAQVGADIPVADLLKARLEAASRLGWSGEDLSALSEACCLETGMERAAVPALEAAPAPPKSGAAVPSTPVPVQAPPPREDPAPPPALNDNLPPPIDLDQTTHFELIKGRVWVWTQGRCYNTPWETLGEVQRAFHRVILLPVKRRILLRPGAVLDLRPTFGGGAKARLSDQIELHLSRTEAARLRDLLGIA